MKRLIAVCGTARSGKTTFANLAASMGCDIVDISKFLARMTVARLGLAGKEGYDLQTIDRDKDNIYVANKSFRSHIIETGNDLDFMLPGWVVSEVLKSNRSVTVVPSIKDEQQLRRIKELGRNYFKVETVQIRRPTVGKVADVRVPYACEQTIVNDGIIADFYQETIAYLKYRV